MRLLVVGEQKLLLDMLKECLSKRFGKVFVDTDMKLVEKNCVQLFPDIVLMDCCTKAGNTGLYVAAKIKARFPKIKVVLMTGYEDISFIDRAREAQVDSFIYKSSSIENLTSCLIQTLAGKKCYPPPPVEDNISFGNTHEHLTPRELGILRLFCQSKSRKEMAEALGVTTSTINFHINNMLVKTGYKKLMSLAMEAANKGYIRIEDENNC